jgi:hypothetical protein
VNDDELARAVGMPRCAARINTDHASYTCILPAAHNDDERSEWHASAWEPWDCYVWNDEATGVTPHHSEEQHRA